eukprot:scaffold76744_cov36-Prasinocladus_malaysianus.AAC.1
MLDSYAELCNSPTTQQPVWNIDVTHYAQLALRLVGHRRRGVSRSAVISYCRTLCGSICTELTRYHNRRPVSSLASLIGLASRLIGACPCYLGVSYDEDMATLDDGISLSVTVSSAAIIDK